jgi:hypothetical protein
LKQHLWKDEALCLGMDNNAFFDKYEDHEGSRKDIEALCKQCPVKKICFANGISGKEWGVWGGVYLEGGDISREFNKHKTKHDWSLVWKSLTIEE